MMTDQRDTDTDKAKLERIEEDIEKARNRQEQERQEDKDDRFAFSTPEAYEAEQLEHADEQHREEDDDPAFDRDRETREWERDQDESPMERPTTTRAGTAAHGAFGSAKDDKSETEKAAERATGKRD